MHNQLSREGQETTLDRYKRILLLNLMPNKHATESQFARLLGSTPYAVDLVPMGLESYAKTRVTASGNQDTHYVQWPQISNEVFDGLIVTGAPLEHLPFEEFDCWDELLEIFSWAECAVHKRLFVCWAAQAALYFKYGIEKQLLGQKLCGVHRQLVLKADAPLVHGLGREFPTPVSRHTTILREAIEAIDGLEILAASRSGDVSLVQSQDQADTYMFNHLEYDAGTLAAEYHRDRFRGASIVLPENYFPRDDPGDRPLNTWSGVGRRFITNWLRHCDEPLNGIYMRPVTPRRKANGDQEGHERGLRQDRRAHNLVDVWPATQTSPPYLLTPGPMALARNVKERMLRDSGSRSVYFKDLTRDVRSRLTRIAGSKGSHTTILIQGSGSFAMEAAITTFVGSQDKVLVLVNGIYGERIATILSRNGLSHEVMSSPSTQAPDVDAVSRKLELDRTFTHLCFVYCETTTGIANPYAELIHAARSRGVLSIVDSMSAFGALPINAAEDGFDILVSSGNKCVEAPPGVAFAVVAKSLLTRKSTHSASFCFDLYDQWQTFEKTGEWRSTPPTHVVQALHTALEELEREGVAERYRRYARIRDHVVDGMRPMGFEPILAPSVRSPICVAFRCPAWAGQEAACFARLHEHLEEAGLHIYAKLHGPTSSFRVGCIGQIEAHWIDLFLERVANFQSVLACPRPMRPVTVSHLMQGDEP